MVQASAKPTIQCGRCVGKGTVAEKRTRWIGGAKLGFRDEWYVDVTCPRCNGTGRELDWRWHPDPDIERESRQEAYCDREMMMLIEDRTDIGDHDGEPF